MVLRDPTVRVKIWNQEGMVVFSDDPEIIGRIFPQHKYLRAALAGQVAYDVSSLDELTPDRVHILVDGKVVDSGGPELARRLEEEGYEAWR